MSAAHPGWISVGAAYLCERCLAGTELRTAIERNDSERARFIATHAPAAHGDGCAAAGRPMFTVEA